MPEHGFNVPDHWSKAMNEKILIDRELLEELRNTVADFADRTDIYLIKQKYRNLAAKAEAALAAPQQEPVGEEVEVVGYASTVVPEDTPLMTVTQHQRIVDGLMEEVERLKGKLVISGEINSHLQVENDKLRGVLKLCVRHVIELCQTYSNPLPEYTLKLARETLATTQENPE
jgi:hypothetical protein